MKKIYLTLAIICGIIPYLFFFQFIQIEGLNCFRPFTREQSGSGEKAKKIPLLNFHDLLHQLL